MNPILSKLRRTLLNFSREYPVLRKVKLIYSSFLREYPALKKIKLVYIFGAIFSLSRSTLVSYTTQI